MPNIQPKFGVWFNFIALVLTGIGAGAIQWGDLEAGTVTLLKTVAADSLFVITCANMVFHFYAAPTAGPLAK